MVNVPLRRYLELLAFASAMLLSTLAREASSPAVTQAVIWLPTGVAIAGVWLLGFRSAWVVGATTLIHRLAMVYPPAVVVAAAIGSTAEAMFGVWVMRRLGMRSDLGRLRDALAVVAAAVVAPIASILASWISRRFPESWRDLPFYSGWDGWWQMNTLGALAVVPLVLTWRSQPPEPRSHRHLWAEAILLLATLGVLGAVMLALPASPTTITLLYLVLPIALFGALRTGQRGAACSATVGALLVATLTTHDLGPFLCVPIEERHRTVQIFLLTLLVVPLVVGSLVAEREAGMTRWLQSEGLREALLRVLPDVTYRLRRDGTFVDAFTPEGTSPPFAPETLIGRNFREIVDPALAGTIQAAIDMAHRGTRPEPVEYEIATPQGSRTREARFARVVDDEVLAVVRDITASKRAQRQLAWQADILERIASGRPNAEVFDALLHGLEGLLSGGLGSLMLLRGQHLHVAAGKNLPAPYLAAVDGIEIGPDRGCCGTAAFTNRTVVSHDIAADPKWARFRDTAQAHGLHACWSVPVRTPGGSVCGTFAIYHREPHSPDATELAYVERAAMLAGLAIDRERREDLLASIHRNVGEGLYRCVPGLGLVYANDAFARLFGYGSPEELLAAAAGRAETGPHARDLAYFADMGKGHATMERQFHRRDGTKFWGLVSSTTMLGPGGVPTACDGALADITAQKQLEEQLRQAQKMEAVGKLAGGVAHDFNNLLTAIGGYAEAVREQVPSGSEAQQDLDEILRATGRAAGLTRQLLAFSRQQVLSPRVVDLGQVVRELGSMLQRLIGEHIRFSTSFAPEPCCVQVDRGQLEQVLLNLVVNARDAMPDGGNLSISIDLVHVDAAMVRQHVDLNPGPYVALSVRDTGCGMSREVQSRAFDPFFTTKELGKGTGLGLSTVYGILKQSGGAVWIDSAPGAGATVWIYLPRVAAQPEQEPPVTIPRPAARPASVLVVEDEALVRDLVERILRRAGYHVVTANDGPSALAAARHAASRFDMLVTDMVMPHLGGREVASRLRVGQPELPVLFMSGYASDSQHVVTAIPGPAEFLQKPFEAAKLLDLVASLLARQRQTVGSDAATERRASTGKGS